MQHVYPNRVVMTYPGQEANHGLHLVPSDGISDECQRLVSNDIQELKRVEEGQVASIGLPPPLQEVSVGPAVLEAVLVLVDSPARRVCVVRGFRVRDPFSREDIAVFAIVDYLDILWCRIDGRRWRWWRVVRPWIVKADYHHQDYCCRC